MYLLPYTRKLCAYSHTHPAESRYGYTALHTAAIYGHETIVQLLLRNGAGYPRMGARRCIWRLGYGHELVVQQLFEKWSENLGEKRAGSYGRWGW